MWGNTRVTGVASPRTNSTSDDMRRSDLRPQRCNRDVPAPGPGDVPRRGMDLPGQGIRPDWRGGRGSVSVGSDDGTEIAEAIAALKRAGWSIGDTVFIGPAGD